MPPLMLTFDAQVTTANEPGFFHEYDAVSLIRGLNPVQDAVSPEALWHDQFNSTLMLTPEPLNRNYLNSSAQLPYIIRLTPTGDFQANPANMNSVHLFEANLSQNLNNPFIHHTPITPALPSLFVDSPEQAGGASGLIDLNNNAADPALTSTFPHAAPPGSFPGVSPSDAKILCWTANALPWNMPLYLRWWVPPSQAGHMALYDFFIGQFCVRMGPTTVEVFKDVSTGHDRSAWRSVTRTTLFGTTPVQTTGFFSSIISHIVTEYQGHLRGLLWLPYRRNYVYMESSYGHAAAFKAQPFAVGNGIMGAHSDWGIVESRNLVVGALTPGPGFFQVQKVKFADGPGKFNLEPFVTDYLSSVPPANNWLVDNGDVANGATISHTTPSAPVAYTYIVNDIDHCAPVLIDPVTDQTRTYGSVYTLTPGTDPTNGALKTYTPMLYSIEARVPRVTQTWPKSALSIQDLSIAPPSARTKRAEITTQVNEPGHFLAEVEDLGASLGAYYVRSEFPLSWSDSNGTPGNPALWTTLWLGIAEPVDTRELRLDTVAPRELRVGGTDFWKWLNETPMRDQRDWTGFGHIYVLQQILQQAGLSVAGWDGPAAGTVVQKTNRLGQIEDVFVPDALGYDTPLSGPPVDDPTIAMGIADANTANPVRSVWRPLLYPPDSYGSFIRRIAELWSGWDFGFHPNGTFYYHRWDFYSTSEATFHQDATTADPHYHRGTVQYEPLYPDANAVVIQASTPGGSLIASSVWEDFASINNPAAVNFIGKEKALYAAAPGVLNCDSLNAVARAVWERARRRRLRVHFRGTYVPSLRIGHAFTLQGETGTWRLQSVRATYERQGWDIAEYVGELIEAGHN